MKEAAGQSRSGSTKIRICPGPNSDQTFETLASSNPTNPNAEHDPTRSLNLSQLGSDTSQTESCMGWKWNTGSHGLLLFQVSQVIAQLFQMRMRMKNLLGVMEGGSIPALSNLEEALKEEQKVNSLTVICAHRIIITLAWTPVQSNAHACFLMQYQIYYVLFTFVGFFSLISFY